ncbi:MAG: DUF1629 domain-containing protein [Novosphingobium sp.]
MREIPEAQARYKQIGLALAKDIEAKWLAGDRNRNSPDYPFFVPSPVPKLLEGWRWPIPAEPFRAQLVKHEGPLVDIVCTTFGSWALSQRVIDLIEAIEPGVHQYLPFELLQPDGSVHPDRRWILNVCTRAEAVDVEASNVVWSPPPVDRWFGDLMGKKHIVLKAENVAGRALWCEWRYNNSPNTFASDKFWDALQKAKARGWEPDGRDPQHMEEI